MPETPATPTPKLQRISRYKWVLRGIGVLHAAAAAAVFFFPNELVYLLNLPPNVFKLGEPLPTLGMGANGHFWSMYAAALFGNLAALSFLAAESPHTRGYSLAHLLALVIAGAGFAYLYSTQKHCFAYVFGIAIDAPLVALIAWNLLRIGRAPRPSPAPGETS